MKGRQTAPVRTGNTLAFMSHLTYFEHYWLVFHL